MHGFWAPLHPSDTVVKRNGKPKKNGDFNQFYENMRLADSGDIVFSYYTSRIQKVGVVLRTAVTSRKPTEFGTAGSNWSDEGWLVPVEWHDVPTVIRPREILQELLPVLPDKYSPLNPETGDGLQAVYLASVPDEMASILLKNVGIDHPTLIALSEGATDDGRAVSSVEDQIEKEIHSDTNIDTTERIAIAKARRGQGRFRPMQCRLSQNAELRALPIRAC
jgi:putative restriction endonuclease